MSDDNYTKVSAEKFQRYPGLKKSEGSGSGLQFFVRNDEQRPASPRGRELADKLIEFMRAEGLVDDLGTGGIAASLAISHLSEAVVIATDECLPQYARGAVNTLSKEVARHAEWTQDWSVGATSSGETTLERRERDEPPTPGM